MYNTRNVIVTQIKELSTNEYTGTCSTNIDTVKQWEKQYLSNSLLNVIGFTCKERFTVKSSLCPC